MHNSGRGAKYTRSRIPVKMLCWWPYQTKSEALKAEYAFKQLDRKEKVKRIEVRSKWIQKEFPE